MKRTPPRTGTGRDPGDASGLNFRDVLNTLGMYPGEGGPLGTECAGESAAVGEGVEGLQVGDRVHRDGESGVCDLRNRRGGARRLQTGSMTMEDGATIPVTFLTAHSRCTSWRGSNRVSAF